MHYTIFLIDNIEKSLQYSVINVHLYSQGKKPETIKLTGKESASMM